MTLSKRTRIVFSLATGVLFAFVFLLVLYQTPPAAASVATYFAAPAGSGTTCSQAAPCSLQAAVAKSVQGDIIYAAGGKYTGTGGAVITITQSINLYGGWDGAATGPVVRDPDLYATTLDGGYARRVVYITGTVAPALEGLTLQQGEATGLHGDPFGFDVGGAVYSYNASPVISNCHILSSTAQFGGGVALYYGVPTVANSLVKGNKGSLGGGGVFLYHSPATVEGNTILTNTALLGTGTYNGGGGLYLDTSAATIRNNVIQDNYGQPYGGGLFVYSSAATISGNAIEDNTAHHGGGLFVAQSPAQLQANTIVDNRATIGTAGLEIFQSNPFTMTNNVIALNLSLVAFPGALYSHNSWGTLVHNTFMENHPVPLPIGCVNGSTLAFTNTIFGPPGGIWVDGSSSVMLDTTLWFPQGIPTVKGLGTIVSSTNLYGDPRFYSPAFHIAFGSAAIDAGAPTWVTTDIDGDPRPYGSYPDIGADEFQGAVFVPLVMKNY